LYSGTFVIHSIDPTCTTRNGCNSVRAFKRQPQAYTSNRSYTPIDFPSKITTKMTSVFRPSARALITGGSSGIGLSVARLCLKNSMKVTIADFNQETLDLAKKSLEGDVTCVKADVGDRAEWKKLKEKVGDVDFLMLNAGVGGAGEWGDGEYFDRVRNPVFTTSI
jgi:hypothetical protein